MSENSFPQFPEREPSPKIQASDYPTNGEAGCGGAFLFFVTLLFSIGLQSYVVLGIGFVLALAGLFFRGYRGVFIGFILSALIIGGLFALILAMFCSGLRNI